LHPFSIKIHPRVQAGHKKVPGDERIKSCDYLALKSQFFHFSLSKLLRNWT